MTPAASFTAARDNAGSRGCNVVGVGSSTMQGYLQTDTEKKWFTRLIRAWQAESGGSDAVQYSDSATFTARTGAGVHGYNAGLAGTTSANYLNADKIARINALNPAVVLHAICSNDMVSGVDPFTAKANLINKLDRFDAGTQHIFVHHHKRFNAPSFRYFWGDYLLRLREIEADRANVLVVNLAWEFEHELGIPDADPFRLVLADKTHFNSEGHAVLAYLAHKAIRNA